MGRVFEFLRGDELPIQDLVSRILGPKVIWPRVSKWLLVVIREVVNQSE